MRKNVRAQNPEPLPTIIQDINTKEVLMLGYSNNESIKITKKTGKVTFFSRSRNKLWTKGAEKSGNFLMYKKMLWDCDQDALLILADPVGPTCHKNNFKNYSCFQKNTRFTLQSLEKIIQDRKNNNIKNSYTRKLLNNTQLIKRKILEEASETILENNKKRIIEESSDLIYHLMVYLAKKNISLTDMENELNKRNKL